MAPNANLKDAISDLFIQEAMAFGGITIYPIHRSSTPKEKYLLLEQAEEMGLVTVTETGRIHQLRVKNLAQHPVLIVAGAQLLGGLQNRIVNTTILVPAGKTIAVPSSCVEQGRWSPTRHRRAGDDWIGVDRITPRSTSDREREREELRLSAMLPAPPSVRGQALVDTHRSLRHLGAAEADQVAVWERVSRMLRRHGIDSPTEALADAYEKEAPTLNRYVANLPYPEGAVGAVVAAGANPRWVELVSRPEAMQYLWPRLVKSWALEYGGKAGGFVANIDQASRLLATIGEAPADSFKGHGLGTELRFESSKVTGSALVFKGELLHLVATATD